MIFGASKLGVINNVHLIKMVRKIQKGKKSNNKNSSCYFTICGLPFALLLFQGISRLLWATSSSFHAMVIFYPKYCRENCFENHWGGSRSFSSCPKALFYTLSETKRWWILIWSLWLQGVFHTQTLTAPEHDGGKAIYSFLGPTGAQSISVLLNTPELTFPIIHWYPWWVIHHRTAQGCWGRTPVHPVFIFGVVGKESLALTAQGWDLEGHRKLEWDVKRDRRSAQTLPCQSLQGVLETGIGDGAFGA